jgi:hypothetical protein
VLTISIHPKNKYHYIFGFKLLVFVLAPFCCTKSLSCTVTDFTGMPYRFRVFKYLEFISLIWKGPYYDKVSVTSIKKEFLDSKKTAKSTGQQKMDPEFIVRTA